jgi:hypothetical protein
MEMQQGAYQNDTEWATTSSNNNRETSSFDIENTPSG